MTILFDCSVAVKSSKFGAGVLRSLPHEHRNHTAEDERWAAAAFADNYPDESPELDEGCYYDREEDGDNYAPFIDHPHGAFIGGLE